MPSWSLHGQPQIPLWSALEQLGTWLAKHKAAASGIDIEAFAGLLSVKIRANKLPINMKNLMRRERIKKYDGVEGQIRSIPATATQT